MNLQTLLPHYRNSQLFQLALAHWSGRVHHQVDGFDRFWEGDDFAQADGAGEDHHDAVGAERDASVRGRAGQ
jgi:hypothetical protein